jgi:outer membrane protein assembly factor BamE (lipoprotein component of BamABCDE complex)
MHNELGNRNPSSKLEPIVIVLWLALCLSGCYLPPIWDRSDEINRVPSIRPGITTKEEVVNILGPPHSKNRTGKSFEYYGTKSRGLIIIPLPQLAFSLISEKRWKLVVSFDENNIVTSVLTITDNSDIDKTSGVPNSTDIGKQAGVYCPNADLGHADAQLHIGDIYSHGSNGQKVDPVRAWVWYSLAAQNGDAQAAEQLYRVTAELTAEQLDEAKRQLAAWKPGQCLQELTPDHNKQGAQ